LNQSIQNLFRFVVVIFLLSPQTKTLAVTLNYVLLNVFVLPKQVPNQITFFNYPLPLFSFCLSVKYCDFGFGGFRANVVGLFFCDVNNG
jgi:hypothetical protein